MSTTNITPYHYNFKTKLPISSSTYYQPSIRDCPWHVFEKRFGGYVSLALTVCISALMMGFSVFCYYQLPNTCYGVDQNCAKWGWGDVKFAVAVLALVFLVVSNFSFHVAEFMVFIIKRYTNVYKDELAARVTDPHQGQSLQEYLQSIIPFLSLITEIEEVKVGQQGLYFIPPYSKLSRVTREKLWYFDHVVKDYNCDQDTS